MTAEAEIRAEAVAEGNEIHDRLNDVDRDARPGERLPREEIAAEHPPRIRSKKGAQRIQSRSSRPVMFKKTSSSVAGLATCRCSSIPCAVSARSKAPLSSV